MTTFTARERLDSSVRHLVFAQVSQLFESLVTRLASLVHTIAMEWLLTSVNPLVGHQVALLVEIFLANLTLIIIPPDLLRSLHNLSRLKFPPVNLLLEKWDREGLASSGDDHQVAGLLTLQGGARVCRQVLRLTFKSKWVGETDYTKPKSPPQLKNKRRGRD